MSDKKTNRSVLGPRGRRKLGLAKGENYKDPGGHQSGYLGSQVKQRKMLDEQGFEFSRKAGWSAARWSRRRRRPLPLCCLIPETQEDRTSMPGRQQSWPLPTKWTASPPTLASIPSPILGHGQMGSHCQGEE